jgi:hypothetical protein
MCSAFIASLAMTAFETGPQISEAIKNVIGRERIEALGAKVRTVLSDDLPSVFGTKLPSEEGFRRVRATQYEASQLDSALKDEARGICPDGELMLVCTRNGMPLCLPRN